MLNPYAILTVKHDRQATLEKWQNREMDFYSFIKLEKEYVPISEEVMGALVPSGVVPPLPMCYTAPADTADSGLKDLHKRFLEICNEQ